MTASEGPLCDRCGRLEPDRYRFCPNCSLFVCAQCWDRDHAICLTCSRPNLPTPGMLHASIRNTIGQRPIVGTSDTRIGRALSGHPGEEHAAAAVTARHQRQTPSLSEFLPSLSTIITSVVLVVALFALPVLGRLFSGAPATSPPAPSVAEQSVRGSTSSPRAERRYTVQRGDTLRSIARDLYGDEERWLAIYRANQARIDDPDNLRIGSTLVIP
jgi:hypothetical protein